MTEADPRTGKNEQELDPVELPLSADAQQMAIAAMNQFETLMQAGNDLSELKDRASKALENACRIAGVLTAIEDGMAAREIDTDRLSRALVLIQWYLKETLRIKGAAVIPLSVTDAESLSRWLDVSGYRVFKTRQVLNKGPSHLRNKKRCDAAIGELVTNGYLTENEPGMIIDDVVTKKSWSVQHVV